jgi:hypothetical protein
MGNADYFPRGKEVEEEIYSVKAFFFALSIVIVE